MTMILGSHLGPKLQREALSAYVHRFTSEHIPQWSKRPMPNGKAYPVQFANDADWLANTYFPIDETGKLSRKIEYCESYPTWPNNPELRK